MKSYPKPIETIPDHLQPFVTTQDPTKYTPVDHACWRYILRISKRFFKEHAHEKYLHGLEETGISTDRIPLIEEMDRKLRKFGWRAVSVVGFIPPAAFMEFQSLGVLPIACDMRTNEHIAYTPAPDIVHEAAGHAPIIADPEYSNYLRNYGEVSRKAIYSKNDTEVYLAIRNLSDVKEAPESTEAEIQSAQKRLDKAIAKNEYISEAALLARMNWWTVEYGLVGDLNSPLIYGAGLLSSVGESYSCIDPKVKKIPFTLDCLNTAYDITRPQPQLFVTPNFERLTEVLEDFAGTMAFRRGGVYALAKGRMSEEVTTSVYDSGIQVSGVLSNFLTDGRGDPSYLQLTGPTQLGYEDLEIKGHGPDYHKEGFGSPVGLIKGKMGQSAADLSASDLKDLGFNGDSKGTLEFESGVVLTGRLENSLQKEGKNIILTFKDCKVNLGDKILFDPSWGPFDMACGARITSVFGGAADRAKYGLTTGKITIHKANHKTNLTPKNEKINHAYGQVREVRESGDFSDKNLKTLEEVKSFLDEKYPQDWLLRLELLELDESENLNCKWAESLSSELDKISKSEPEKSALISRGLELFR